MDDGVHTDHKAGVICLCGYSPDAEITTLRARVRELEEHMALSGTPSTPRRGGGGRRRVRASLDQGPGDRHRKR